MRVLRVAGNPPCGCPPDGSVVVDLVRRTLVCRRHRHPQTVAVVADHPLETLDSLAAEALANGLDLAAGEGGGPGEDAYLDVRRGTREELSRYYRLWADLPPGTHVAWVPPFLWFRHDGQAGVRRLPR
ncbi:protein of unknown function [Candidatus Hydrogenisulfobacillus filiaventi]|uniref:Uncharacterized protein n=1 Tax=Candidatus Hydrogenisulfobacillus filiaventi TaxID=2707344 RepID=A0A6F8ZCN2_9FIRM|nr:protein of unknown function [Candidatus Hydrogenisulfobacillus filiaventi]